MTSYSFAGNGMALNQITLPILAGFILSFSARAQIYESTFTDTNSKVVNIRSTSNLYNPASPVTITMISGLDRYLTVNVVNAAGKSMFTQKTSLTTVDDRIQASDGNEFYGKKMILPVLSDGGYSIIITLSDLKNAVVATYEYKWTFDTVKPSANRLAASVSRGSAPVGGVWKMGVEAGNQFDFYADGIADGSGIAGGVINFYNPDGSLFSSPAMKYDEAGKKLYFTYSNRSVMGVGMPTSDLNEVFQAQVAITDKAGNTTLLEKQPFYWDNVIGEITLYAVHDPANPASVVPGISSNYTAYKAGMTVNENPVRLVYKLPVANVNTYRLGGLEFINKYAAPTEISNVDGYVYMEMKMPYNAFNTDMARIANFAAFGGYSPNYKMVLSPNADKTPVFTGPLVEFRDSKGEWSKYDKWDHVLTTDLPIKLDRIRFTVESRPFTQVVAGKQTCTVPAGQTQCEAAADYNLALGTSGWVRTLYYVKSASEAALRSENWIVTSWNDEAKPAVNSVTLDNTTNILTVLAFVPGDGDWLNWKALRTYYLTDENTGKKLSPVGTLTARVNGNNTITFPMSTQAEGSYKITANVTDYYQNIASKSFGDVIIDRTPPKAVITYEDKPLSSGVTVMGLENLSITLSDNLTTPKITRALLTGGPTSDSVDLNWSSTGKNTFRVEYPRVFPSIDQGDSYTLTITAEDEQNNRTTTSATFKYLPNNLVQLQNLRTLAVNSALKTSTNEPLAFMKTSVLRKENGEIAKGVQRGTLTVRRDAAFSITINSVSARPGETVEISIDMGIGEEVLVPIFPAENGKTGTASFLIEFPQLS